MSESTKKIEALLLQIRAEYLNVPEVSKQTAYAQLLMRIGQDIATTYVAEKSMDVEKRELRRS